MRSSSESNAEGHSAGRWSHHVSSLTPEEDSLPDLDDDDVDDSLPADLWFRSSRGRFRRTGRPTRLPG